MSEEIEFKPEEIYDEVFDYSFKLVKKRAFAFSQDYCGLLKINKNLQQELTKYKERNEKCVNLLKLIQRNLPGYYNQLLIEIRDLLEILEDKEKK